MIRNPNHSTPRTLRDCTFCDWADPIHRPARGPGIYWRLINWLIK